MYLNLYSEIAKGEQVFLYSRTKSQLGQGIQKCAPPLLVLSLWMGSSSRRADSARCGQTHLEMPLEGRTDKAQFSLCLAIITYGNWAVNWCYWSRRLPDTQLIRTRRGSGEHPPGPSGWKSGADSRGGTVAPASNHLHVRPSTSRQTQSELPTTTDKR